jgi:hypothetical protein
MGYERFTELVETAEGWLKLEAEAYCADLRQTMTTERGGREGTDALIERFLSGRRYRHLQRLGHEHVERVIYEACGQSSVRIELYTSEAAHGRA